MSKKHTQKHTSKTSTPKPSKSEVKPEINGSKKQWHRRPAEFVVDPGVEPAVMVDKVLANMAETVKRGRVGRLRRMMLYQKEVYSRLLALIQSGVSDFIAAEFLRIDCNTFRNWLRRGHQERKGIYRRFLLDVMQAQAHARLNAELVVRKENPLAWLRLGPGRTQPGRPGWTEAYITGHDPDMPLQVEHSGQVEHKHAHIHIPAVAAVSHDPSSSSNGSTVNGDQTSISSQEGNGGQLRLTDETEKKNPSLAGVLAIWEEIGIVQPTELGKTLLNPKQSLVGDALLVEATHVESK